MRITEVLIPYFVIITVNWQQRLLSIVIFELNHFRHTTDTAVAWCYVYYIVLACTRNFERHVVVSKHYKVLNVWSWQFDSFVLIKDNSFCGPYSISVTIAPANVCWICLDSLKTFFLRSWQNYFYLDCEKNLTIINL